MNESILIDQIATAVAVKIAQPIPLSVDLWDSATIGQFLKVSAKQVTDRYAPLPDFPKAIRLPAPGSGKGHPRWKAVEIIEWAERYLDGNGKGRPRKVAYNVSI